MKKKEEINSVYWGIPRAIGSTGALNQNASFLFINPFIKLQKLERRKKKNTIRKIVCSQSDQRKNKRRKGKKF
mgnify:CR=1 FL=1